VPPAAAPDKIDPLELRGTWGDGDVVAGDVDGGGGGGDVEVGGDAEGLGEGAEKVLCSRCMSGCCCFCCWS